MGNLDKWTTPKQIKIEREGEPRGVRRGPLKKGERRKGIKARRDELLSSMRQLKWYAERMIEDRKRRQEHPEWYLPTKYGYHYNPHWDKSFDEQQKKHIKLLKAAFKDGVIDPANETWTVDKP